MPPTTPDKLERALEAGRRGGVFFLHGEEEFLKQAAERRLVEAHLDPATADFNHDQLSGDDLDAEAFASIVATPPMMAEWRVVVVREAQAFAGSPTLRGMVEELLERPPPGLALVFSARIPPGSKARFYETLKKGAVSIDFPRLSADDLPGWLVEHAAARDVRLKPEAARALVSAVGTDLGILIQELAKLRDFAGEGVEIGTEAVEKAVGAIHHQDRWAWFDLVGSRGFREARTALPVLLDSGESGVGLVIGLSSQFLRLALAVAGGDAALAAELPRHQKWLSRRLAAQARGWSAGALRDALEDLLRADRLLKSTALGDQAIMEELLFRLDARSQGLAA